MSQVELMLESLRVLCFHCPTTQYYPSHFALRFLPDAVLKQNNQSNRFCLALRGQA